MQKFDFTVVEAIFKSKCFGSFHSRMKTCRRLHTLRNNNLIQGLDFMHIQLFMIWLITLLSSARQHSVRTSYDVFQADSYRQQESPVSTSHKEMKVKFPSSCRVSPCSCWQRWNPKWITQAMSQHTRLFKFWSQKHLFRWAQTRDRHDGTQVMASCFKCVISDRTHSQLSRAPFTHSVSQCKLFCCFTAVKPMFPFPIPSQSWSNIQIPNEHNAESPAKCIRNTAGSGAAQL